MLTEKQIKHLEIENRLSTKLKNKYRAKKLASNPQQEHALATMLSVSEMLENLPELKDSVNKIFELQKSLFGIYDIKQYEEAMIQIYTTAMENAINIESDFNSRLTLYPENSQKNLAINTSLKEIYEILSRHISDENYKLTEYKHPDTGDEIDSSMILNYLDILGFYQSSLADQYGLLSYKKSLDIHFLLSHSTSNFRNQSENMAYEIPEGIEFNEEEAYAAALQNLNDYDYRVFQNFMYVASKEPEILNDFKRIIALKQELQQYISVQEIETKIADILESLNSYLDADNTTALSPEEFRDSIEELEAQEAKAKAKADIKDEDEIPAKNKLH